MNGPLTWSFPVGRVAGVLIRIHLIYPIVFVAMVYRGWQDGYPGAALWMQVLLFVSVLLHEFGHCFGARYVEGEASEILMWPLGGLASVDVPHNARAHFIMTLAGPLVNFVLFAVCAVLLFAGGVLPPISPFWEWTHLAHDGVDLIQWHTGNMALIDNVALVSLARLFWVNWLLFWFNVLILGYPLDGGQLLQAALWPRYGYYQSSKYTIYSGFFFVGLLFIIGFSMAGRMPGQEVLLIWSLSFWMLISCHQKWLALEAGALHDEGIFGYDFSQGYTSLERGQQQQQPKRKPRPNFIQRWLQRRAERKRQLEEEQRQADEHRLDELLDKVQQHGLEALSPEEKRFLTRFSAKLRNKQQD
jgi:Zn-dependent protease